MDSAWLQDNRDHIANSVIGGETLITQRTTASRQSQATLAEQIDGLVIDASNPAAGEAEVASLGLKRGNILAQSRAYYLGFGTPSESHIGISMMQDPLRELYEVGQGRHGEPGWLVALEDGIQFQPRDKDEPIWIPTQSIRICAALQRQEDGQFVDLDSAADNNAAHPIFSIVKERVEVPDENHAFVCSSRNAALAMVRAASYSYQHKEGWSDVQYGYYFKKVNVEKRIEVPTGLETVGSFGPQVTRHRSQQPLASSRTVTQPILHTPVQHQALVPTQPIQHQALVPTHPIHQTSQIPAGQQGQTVRREVVGRDGQRVIYTDHHIYRKYPVQQVVKQVVPVPQPAPPPPVFVPQQPQIILIQKEEEQPAPVTVIRTVEQEPCVIQPVQTQFIDRQPCDIDYSYVPSPANDTIFDNDPARVQLYQHDGFEYDYRSHRRSRRAYTPSY